ncbi:MAG: DsbA family protein [Microthrixaceae bacterium]
MPVVLPDVPLGTAARGARRDRTRLGSVLPRAAERRQGARGARGRARPLRAGSADRRCGARESGADAVGRFYEHLGKRVHEQGEALEDPATVEGALVDAGLPAGLCRQAMDDEATAEQVAAEHRELCDRTRSFGVPTIVLDGGAGAAIFGPVITEVPDDDDAVALWEHVSWLTRYGNFAELKRDRTEMPELESVRQWQARRNEPGA